MLEPSLHPLETLVGTLEALRPGRREDIESKHQLLAPWIKERGCEGFLIFEPENFAWLTSGGYPRGILDPSAMPVLCYNTESRWVLCGNGASQRLFEEELDGLGYQLKEWPWHWGRQQLLADLIQGRVLGADRVYPGTQDISATLRQPRWRLTPYEQACLEALGPILSHAVEATCRTMEPGQTEREVAAQISHRLLHRGAIPLQIGVAADGRSRLYRQFGFTSTPIRHAAVLLVTARKYGLHATVSRSVSFGAVDPTFHGEHNAVCKVGATYLASTWPDALPKEIFSAGRRVYTLCQAEHEWRLAPQGFQTGRAAVERMLTPSTEEVLEPGWAITWMPSVGAAVGADTFLITENGPRLVTPTESWPLKRIRIQGADFVRPDILIR